MYYAILRIMGVIWAVLAVVSWLEGLGFMTGAMCLALSELFQILSIVTNLAERGE